MEFTVETEDRLETIDITDRVASAIPPTFEGVCTVFSKHTTAGILVTESERRLRRDFERWLSSAVADDGWAHDEIDGNADAHLRAAIVGSDATIPAADGSLDLGTWQSILLVECDGPRPRTVSVHPLPTGARHP